MRLFDSHAHIGSPDLEPQADSILARARDAGVVGVIAVGAGYGVGPNGVAVSLAERHRDVWATVGVHPHDASEWNELAREAIDGWLLHERVMAVVPLQRFSEQSLAAARKRGAHVRRNRRQRRR